MTRQIVILNLMWQFNRRDRPANEQRHAEGPERAIPGVHAGGLEAAMGSAAQFQGQIPEHLVSRGQHNIRVAGERKFEAYGELAQAKVYNGAEWRVEILPWVVRVRGIFDTVGIGSALEFLDCPLQKTQGLMTITVLESVYALEFLHKVQQSTHPQSIPVGPGVPFGVNRGKKHKRGGTEDGTWTRWQRLTRDPMLLGLSAAQWRGTCNSATQSLGVG